MPDFAAQLAEFKTETFKDGAPSDGEQTAQEAAAHAANAGASEEQQQTSDSGDGTNVIPADESDDLSVIEDAPADDTDVVKEPKPEVVETDEQKAAKAAKGKKSAQERIGDLTAARRTAEREANTARAEADALKAELEALKSGKTPLTVSPGDSKADTPGSPDPAKFDFGELDPKYIAALARFETGQALAEQAAKDEQRRQSDAAAASQRELNTKLDAFAVAGAKAFDDFDDVVMKAAQKGQFAISDTLGALIIDSDFGPQIAYDLAKDPDEAARVARLSPAQQAAFFGRQEAKFEAAKSSQGRPAPKTPQAQPPPKTPRGGSGSSKIGADTTDFAALEAAWKNGALR